MHVALLLCALAVGGSSDYQMVLDGIRIEQQVPGVSAVAALHQETLFAGASGKADLDNARDMTPETVLYAGSLSKIFTAVLTLILVEEGHLTLDDRIGGIPNPASEDNSEIRLSHLLTHASGLEREGNFGYWFSGNFPDRTALSNYLSSTSLRAEPGSDFHYSNIGYATLGLAIEDATGQSYHEALKDRVLTPLGLQSSGSPGPVTRIAVGYSPVDRVIPSAERPFAGLGKKVGNRYVREYHNAAAMTPAFGVYTSAQDLSQLARFLLSDKRDTALSYEMRRRMLSAQDSGWGLGIKIDWHDGRQVARHSGWFAAHRSHLLLDIDSGISVVVLTNSDNGNPGAIAEALLKTARSSVIPEIEGTP